MRQPAPASALKSVHMLDLLIAFFDGSANWITGDFHNGDGARCLVGAMQHLRAVHRLSGDPTRDYLLAAMPRNWRFAGLMEYNDHCRFSELLSTLCRARLIGAERCLRLAATEARRRQQKGDRAKAARGSGGTMEPCHRTRARP